MPIRSARLSSEMFPLMKLFLILSAFAAVIAKPAEVSNSSPEVAGGCDPHQEDICGGRGCSGDNNGWRCTCEENFYYDASVGECEFAKGCDPENKEMCGKRSCFMTIDAESKCFCRQGYEYNDDTHDCYGTEITTDEITPTEQTTETPTSTIEVTQGETRTESISLVSTEDHNFTEVLEIIEHEDAHMIVKIVIIAVSVLLGVALISVIALCCRRTGTRFV